MFNRIVAAVANQTKLAFECEKSIALSHKTADKRNAHRALQYVRRGVCVAAAVTRDRKLTAAAAALTLVDTFVSTKTVFSNNTALNAIERYNAQTEENVNKLLGGF